MVTVTFNSNGTTIGMLDADSKTFRSGSKGFYGNGKMTIDGKKYQVMTTLVEIGSKPGSKKGK